MSGPSRGAAPRWDAFAPLRDEPFEPPVVASELVFDGRVWNVRREVFELDGHRITREFVDHTGAVAVLALDERDRVMLIRQYRHPIRTRDWELPAGLLDVHGEPPLAAAQRELAEEADLVAADWRMLSEFTSTPGGSTEVVRIYLARNLADADEVFERDEEEAGIEPRWVPLDEAVDAVLDRRIRNGIVSVAVLAARESRDRGWETLGPADMPWGMRPTRRSGSAGHAPERP